MNRLAKILIPVVLVATAASTIVVAQQMRRERQSPETMQRLQEGRIAMVTTALKMNEAQQKLWAPLEAQIKARQAERVKWMQERAEMRAKAQADKSVTRPPLPDLLDRMSARMAKRAEDTKAFAASFRPFYESLSEEQKAVVGPLMAEIGGGRHMRGHRFGAYRGDGPGPQ
jgi:LTXXQ motif family protein